MENLPYVFLIERINRDDAFLVGEKAANLGELTQAGFPVPSGFVITAQAYENLLRENDLVEKIKDRLDTLDVHNSKELKNSSLKIKSLITRAEVPVDLEREIVEHYLNLDKNKKEPWVAVRSSTAFEDFSKSSFAGQQSTFLNVKGTANLFQAVRQAWASLFEPRAIFYRQVKGFEHFKVKIALTIQQMIQAEISGVMFTVDPLTEEKNRLLIEAVFGLGELIAGGAVIPDRYAVDKQSLSVLHKVCVDQPVMLKRVGYQNKKVKVPNKLVSRQKLSEDQIKSLAKLGKKIQQHYFFPQNIEWVMQNRKFFILQSRPVTTLSKSRKLLKPIPVGKSISCTLEKILTGDPASPGIKSGKVRVIINAKEINKLKKGEILVAEMTTPDFVPAMRRLSAIITDKGGQTSDAAIISRELGITCVVGTQVASKKLKNGQLITVNGKTGEIFAGSLSPKKIKIMAGELKNHKILSSRKTATKIYVNLAEPDLAKDASSKNVDGVGLLKAEFMINQIGTHPKKLISQGKQKLFIDKLSLGISTFCRLFSPRPVVYRTTDFKTDDYQKLNGGKTYEPQEANPLLGLRGAFRYISDEAVFDLELKAIRNVRNKMGYKNLWLLLPFVRSVRELEKLKRIIASAGLTRSSTFKLWMMVEIPANVILLEDFIKVGIDGISIGSDDLTTLILGIDRYNPEVSQIFNQRDASVLWALKRVIKIASQQGITSSICGQAPTLYPDLTQKLVNWGITSVSVNPDTVDLTREIVYQAELKNT